MKTKNVALIVLLLPVSLFVSVFAQTSQTIARQNKTARLSAAQIKTIADQRYDLVVVGATGGGIATAIRGAREGLKVLLVNHSEHLGGMLSGGIGVMDSLYEGARAPVLDEFNRRVLDYYGKTYGTDSPQYKAAQPAPLTASPKRLTFESRVAEEVINQMIAAEKNIIVLKGYYPVTVERTERTISAVIFSPNPENPANNIVKISGRIFADATYEADLAALAGVPYRVGREARDEYGEPHAGKIFTKRLIVSNEKGFPFEAKNGLLKMRAFQAVNQEIYAGSTGEGDSKVQAYHYRVTLTADPNNRRPIEKPANYNREQIAKLIDPYRNLAGSGTGGINKKIAWFQNFSGQSSEYPTADWAKRREILQRHKDFALGAAYFLQNDESIPAADREKARQWGLPKDEFVDNDNFPYEVYVREARRIVGRYVFTEHDASLAPGLRRAPVQTDGIAIAEWFMDSHEVSTEKQPGSDFDGKILLSEKTRPSQIPYRTLLPPGIDNLLVPVCLSATHVAWGTIRLEPTWMHIGESAAFAASIAIKRNIAPAAVDPSMLQRRLAENGVMLSFFNDFDMQTKADWVPAVQYLSTKGFFESYDANAELPLSPKVAEEWARIFGQLAHGELRAVNETRRLAQLPQQQNESVTAARFTAMLGNALNYWNIDKKINVNETAKKLNLNPETGLKRGAACRLIYALLAQVETDNR